MGNITLRGVLAGAKHVHIDNGGVLELHASGKTFQEQSSHFKFDNIILQGNGSMYIHGSLKLQVNDTIKVGADTSICCSKMYIHNKVDIHTTKLLVYRSGRIDGLGSGYYPGETESGSRATSIMIGGSHGGAGYGAGKSAIYGNLLKPMTMGAGGFCNNNNWWLAPLVFPSRQANAYKKSFSNVQWQIMPLYTAT